MQLLYKVSGISETASIISMYRASGVPQIKHMTTPASTTSVCTKTLSTDLMLLRSRPRQTWCLLFYSARIDWRIGTLKHGKVVEKSTSFQSLTTEALSQILRCCLKREHRNEKASDKRKKETPVNSCKDILIYGPHQDRWNVSRCFLASRHGCQQLVPSNHQIWGIPSAWNSIRNIPNPWRFTRIFDVPNLL